MLASVFVLSAPASAHHRQTPPLVQVTASGDNGLPRARPGWRRFLLAIDPAYLDPNGYLTPLTPLTQGTTHPLLVRSDWFRKVLEPIPAGSAVANPTIDVNGFSVAWDDDCAAELGCFGGDTGRQIYFWRDTDGHVQLTHDPTGTSVNPFISGRGDLVAFESRGDLAGTGTSGPSQIFLATAAVGTPADITQVTHGAGTSQNAVLSFSGRTLAFESTDDESGNDTGISQIWVATIPGLPQRITHGAAPSHFPDVSVDGRVIAFESTAALAGDGHDTGVSQIFAYDQQTQVFSQLTNDPAGCSRPSVDIASQNHRIAFVCHGVGFFQFLATAQRFRLPIPDGSDTTQAFGIGANFLMVSTTANFSCPRCSGAACAIGTCTTSGTTSGHQLFVINIWKLPAIPVPPSPSSPSGAFLVE